jgi:hypothetical protein
MSDHAAVAKGDLGLDIAAHEESYAGFVHFTEMISVHILNIVLMLVIWGLEGHGFIALLGFILNLILTALGGVTGLGWRLPAGLFVLLGLAAIIL